MPFVRTSPVDAVSFASISSVTPAACAPENANVDMKPTVAAMINLFILLSIHILLILKIALKILGE